jgi:hypothetical protein
LINGATMKSTSMLKPVSNLTWSMRRLGGFRDYIYSGLVTIFITLSRRDVAGRYKDKFNFFQ